MSLSQNPSLFNVENPFCIYDLASLDEKVKRTQLIGHSQGTVFKMRGISAQKQREKYAENLLIQSLIKFRQSLQAVPRNQRTLRNVADVFLHLKKHGLAKLFYYTAIEVMPDDAISLYKYAWFMEKMKINDEAEHYFEQSINVRLTTSCVLAYSKFLAVNQKLDQAASLLEKAINKYPKHPLVQHHYAKFYHIQKLDPERAKKALRDCNLAE